MPNHTEKMKAAIVAKQDWIKSTFKNSLRHQIEADHPEHSANIRDPHASEIFGYDLRV
jgi:hypothetical protein